MAAISPTLSRTEAVRRFNRFYTRRHRLPPRKPRRDSLQPDRIAPALGVRPPRADHRRRAGARPRPRPGYLSRLLRAFKNQQLIRAERSPTTPATCISPSRRRDDARSRRSTDQSAADVAALLAGLADGEQRGCCARWRRSSRCSASGRGAAPWLLRPPHAGDIGWVVARHGALYAAIRLGHALRVAGRADRRRLRRPARPRPRSMLDRRARRRQRRLRVPCAGARRRERRPVDRDRAAAPAARRAGRARPRLGARLVDECERFARRSGYRRIVLWTNSVLVAARAIYAKAGYRLVTSAPHESFGHRPGRRDLGTRPRLTVLDRSRVRS